MHFRSEEVRCGNTESELINAESEWNSVALVRMLLALGAATSAHALTLKPEYVDLDADDWDTDPVAANALHRTIQTKTHRNNTKKNDTASATC